MFTEQSSNNLKVINDNYVFENDTIKVTYSFWAEDGVMAFIIENKLDIPIYIDWKKSAFISTKNKFSYYSENEVTDTKGVGASAMYLYRNVYDWSRWYPVNVSVSESRSVKYKEERITFVPPHAATERASYNIYPRKYIIMDNIKSTQIGDSKAKGKVVSFSKDDAMITFRNFLTYSTKETFETEKYVSNDFYVGKVIELAKKHYTNYEDSKNFYVVPY
jgi:hypothetical protein